MAINVDISKITGINQVGNSYQRKSAVPLDYYSFFNTKAAAETYAASNPVAYIGQYVAYTHEGKVFACVIADEAGTLKEIGSKPIGDNASIEVAEDGKVSLYGFNELTNDKVRYLPVTKLVGEGEEAHLEIEWVSELADETRLEQAASVTAVSDDTSYAIEAVRADKDGNLAVVLPKQPVIDLIKAEVGSAGHLKREIVTKLPAVEDADADTIYMVSQEIVPAGRHYGNIQGDMVNQQFSGFGEDPDCDAVSFVNLQPNRTYQVSSFNSVGDNHDAYVCKDTSAFANDSYDAIPLVEIETLSTDTITLTEDADGIVMNVAKGTTPTLLLVGTPRYLEYMLIDGVFEEIGDTAVDLDGYATEEYVDNKLEAYAYSKLEVNNLIGTPGVPEVTDEDGNVITEAKPGTGVYQHVYSKSEVTDLIADITGGESAADVKAELKEYKTTNDARVLVIEKEVWGVDGDGKTDVTGDSRIDKHANRILALEEKVGHDVEDEGSTATGLFAEIDAVSVRAEQGITDAYNAAQAVVALKQNEVAANTKKVDDLAILVGTNSDYTDNKTGTLAYRIGALEAHDAAHAIEFGTLSGTVGQNTKDIATNKSDINKINTETIPALQAAIKAEEKARKDAIGAPSTPGVGQEGDENYVAPVAATGVYAAIEAVADTIDFTPYLTKVEAGNTYATIPALNGVKSDLAILVGNDKADDGKPTMSVRDIVKAEVGSAGHLKREIVTELPNIAEADLDTIYMIKDTEAYGTTIKEVPYDNYGKYELIDGKYELVEDPTYNYKAAWIDLNWSLTPGKYYFDTVTDNDFDDVGEITLVAGVNMAYEPEATATYDATTHILTIAEPIYGLVANIKTVMSGAVRIRPVKDQYKEYIVVNGAFEQIGDTSIDLTGYATEDFVRELVTNSAPGIATTTTLGLVKSTASGTAAATNKVTVETNGTMTVTKISTDILVQGNEELILFGGTASTAVKA